MHHDHRAKPTRGLALLSSAWLALGRLTCVVAACLFLSACLPGRPAVHTGRPPLGQQLDDNREAPAAGGARGDRLARPTTGRARGEASRTGSETPSAQPPNRDPHGPANLERYVGWLESPERDWFQKPEQVIEALGLEPTARVADLGCGPGYFTRRLARAVTRGLVYAVDVEPQQLYRLQEHLIAEDLHNVVPVLASLSDPHLPPGEIDLILVVDTYHHFDDRPRYLKTLARALKPNGRLVIIDYYKRALPVGPPVDHKVARDVVLREVLAAGYRLLDEPALLPYQYFMIFGRPQDDTAASSASIRLTAVPRVDPSAGGPASFMSSVPQAPRPPSRPGRFLAASWR